MKLTTQTHYKLINESLRDDHREKLITLLLSNVEGATMAIELMKGLDMIVKILPQVTDIPLRRFLGQQINFYLGRMSGLYDLWCKTRVNKGL